MASRAVLDLIVALKDEASAGLSRIAGGVTSVATMAAGAGLAVAGTLAAGLGAAGVAGLQFNSSMEQVEAQLNAFLKDGALVDSTLEMIRRRAAATPFAFEDMARATTSLIPAAKNAGMQLEEMLGIAEILAASNPAEGLAGAAVALAEVASGDLTSIIERFRLPRQRLKELRESGVSDIEAVQIAMKELGFDTSLVTNLANTASGRWSTFMDTLQGLAATATSGLFEGLSSTLGDINAMLADPAVQQQLTTIAEAVGVRLAGAFNWLINTGGPAVMAVWGLIRDAVITFQQALAGDWVDSGIVHPFHRVIGVIGQVVAAFQSGGIQGALDVLLPYIQTAMGNLIAWIQQQAGVLLAAFVTWKDAFVAWVVPATVEFLAQWPGMLSSFLDWIAAAAGPILLQLGDWALSFVEWVVPLIPQILVAVGAINLALLTWIAETAVVLASKIILEWLPALVAWIATDAVPRLLGALGELALKIFEWIRREGPQILEKAKSLGANLINGIKAGLEGALGGLLGAATGMASQLAGSFADFFDMQSPSRLMEQYGGHIGEGLAIGISRAAANAIDAARGMSSDVAGAFAPTPLALAPAGAPALPQAGRSGGGHTFIFNYNAPLTIADGKDRAGHESSVADAATRAWDAAANAGTRTEGGG